MYALVHRGFGSTQQDVAIGSAAASAGAAAAISAGLVASAAIPIIGPAIAAIGLLATKLFSGCGQTCVAATNIVNQAEPLLQQNLNAYLAAPTTANQAQAEANFNQIWAGIVQACTSIGGQGGKGCIADRQRGGKFDWFKSYYDPIANSTPVDSNSAGGALASTGFSGSTLALIGGGLLLLGLVAR